MRISSHDFLNGLRIHPPYFFKAIKRIGVQSRYFFNEDDLLTIKNNLPMKTYKTALIVGRAASILEGSYVKPS